MNAYRERQRAQGMANAHAAVAMVREWGGSLTMAHLRRHRLGKGALRAVQMGLACKSDGVITLNEGLDA